MAMYRFEDNKLIHHHFDSIHDLIEAEITDPTNKQRAQQSIFGRIGHGMEMDNWWGWEDGYEGLLKRLETGWIEGLNLAKQYIEAFDIPQMRGVRRKRIRKQFGDSIDMQSVYAGNIDRAWETTERINADVKGRQHSTILVELSTHCNIDWKKAFWRGAVATLLSDAMQRTGKGVEIIVKAYVTGLYQTSRKHYCYSVVVKGFGQPLDVETLIAATSVGFHRGLGFKAKCLGNLSIDEGFGRPTTTYIPDYFKDPHNTLIHITDIWNKEDANNFLKEHTHEMQEAV